MKIHSYFALSYLKKHILQAVLQAAKYSTRYFQSLPNSVRSGLGSTSM